MSKQTEIVVGHVANDVTVERIMSFLKLDAEAMTGRNQSPNTKQVIIELTVKTIKDVV